MPAKSRAQQAFFAIAEHEPGKLRGPVPKMTKAQLHEFAATKTAGLPRKLQDGGAVPLAAGGEVGAIPAFTYHHLRQGYQPLQQAVRGFQGGGRVVGKKRMPAPISDVDVNPEENYLTRERFKNDTGITLPAPNEQLEPGERWWMEGRNDRSVS